MSVFVKFLFLRSREVNYEPSAKGFRHLRAGDLPTVTKNLGPKTTTSEMNGLVISLLK